MHVFNIKIFKTLKYILFNIILFSTIFLLLPSYLSYTEYLKLTPKYIQKLFYLHSELHNIKPNYTCSNKQESIKAGLASSLIGIDAKNQTHKYIVLQGKLPEIEEGCKNKSPLNSPILFYYLNKNNIKIFEQHLEKQIDSLNLDSASNTNINEHQKILNTYESSNSTANLLNRLLILKLIQPNFELIYTKKTLYEKEIFDLPKMNRKVKHTLFQDKICISMEYHWALTGLSLGLKTLSLTNISDTENILHHAKWGNFACKYVKDPYIIEKKNRFTELHKQNKALVGFTYPIYMYIHYSISTLTNDENSILFSLLKYMQYIIIILILIKAYLIIIDTLLGHSNQVTTLQETAKLIIILSIFTIHQNTSLLTKYIIPSLLQLPNIFSHLFSLQGILCMHENMHIFEILDCMIGKLLGLESLILFNISNDQSALILLTTSLSTALIPTPFTLLISIVLLLFPISIILIPSYITYILVTDLLALSLLLISSPIWGIFFLFEHTMKWAKTSFKLTIGYILKPSLFILPISLTLVLTSKILAPNCEFQATSIIHDQSPKIISLVNLQTADNICKTSIIAKQDQKLHHLIKKTSYTPTKNTKQNLFIYLLFDIILLLILYILPKLNSILINITGTATISLPKNTLINKDYSNNTNNKTPHSNPQQKFNDRTSSPKQAFNDRASSPKQAFNDRTSSPKQAFNDRTNSPK